MNTLKISGINLDISWKDKDANYHTIQKAAQYISTDILLLPEMFATGFYMKPNEIADENEETLRWMKSLAKERQTAVCGSVAVKENDIFYNRMYFVEPNETFYSYDKRHLFSYSGEDKTYTPGKEKVIVHYKGWRILLQVCYDLRFPVFTRNNDNYDVILYVANWPKSRIDAWQTLLKARAIENQAYVFGLNRIGIDGNNLQYPESSYCYFADGTEVSSTSENIISAELIREKLENFREKFPFLSDRDDFSLNLI